MKKGLASGYMHLGLNMMVGEVRGQINGWHSKNSNKQIQERLYLLKVRENRGCDKGYTERIIRP